VSGTDNKPPTAPKIYAQTKNEKKIVSIEFSQSPMRSGTANTPTARIDEAEVRDA
jgi:hypothetical protein